MDQIGVMFGIPKEQKHFAETHQTFLQAYPGLMETVDKVFRRTFDFAPQDALERIRALPEEDEERIKFQDSLLVKRIAYYISRSAVEEFHDIILLAANSKGIGAQKILRGTYERTVTAQFIAMHPGEALPFADDFHIQQWNIIRRWLETAPNEVHANKSEEEIREFKQLADTAQAKRKPFRPLVADSAVLSAINTGMVTPRDFVRVGPSVALTAAGRKGFFRAYELRMDTLVSHPLFDYRVTYRRLLEIQARLLARVLEGEIGEYPVFVTR